MKRLALNSIDVDLTDTIDKKGDILTVVKDTEDKINYCLIRERNNDLLIVGFNSNPKTFSERIKNSKDL